MRFIATSVFLAHPMALACAAGAQQRPDTAMKPLVMRFEMPVASDTSWRLFGDQHVPRAVGASIGVIDSAMLAASSARTLSELLAGRVPGVSVIRSSGVLGTGARVRLRGGSGLLIPREPLLLVDGVRVDADQWSLGIDIGGQQPSRLDDLPLDDVERIVVRRGPAAAALYGTDAAGGVIEVTTRAGRPGPVRWRTYAEGSASTDASDYPANSATGPPAFGGGTCTRAGAALGTCVPGPLTRWNPLEQASPFRTGSGVAGGASVAGGSERVRYYAGGSVAGERGVLAPNDLRRYAGRVNVDAVPLGSLRVALRGSHEAGRTTLPLGDLFPTNTLYSGLMGNTADDPVRRGYLDLDPTTIATVATEQRIARSLGSVAAAWTPVRWLTARSLIGREVVRRDDARTYPMAVAYLDPSRGDGPFQIQGSTGRDKHTTMAGSLTGAYTIAPTLRGATTAGIERLTASFRMRDSLQSFWEDGRPSGFSSRYSREPRKTVGVYAAQQLAWTSRRLFDLGVRRDDGDRRLRMKPATYWSASASWIVSDEPFFHSGRLATALEVHAAYGVGGDARPVRAALGGSESVIFPRPGEEPPPLVFRPEKVSELELGAELGSLRDSKIGVTWYRQRSTNALEHGCCIGVLAYDDGGGWHTDGLELSVASTLFRTFTSRWDARLTFATLSNRFDQSTFNQGRTLDAAPFFGQARRRLIRGYPIAGVWGRLLTGRDANADGVIVPSEITQSADSVYLGSSGPTREAGLATALAVFRRVTVSLQADYHGGIQKLNETEAYRCAVGTCSALYDPRASISDQTRAVADFGEGPGFTERADFVRVREIALTWEVAPGWARRNGMRKLAVTLAGRNLLTLTDYSGIDPEVNSAGQSSFGTTEFFTLPLPRTLVVRLSLER